MLIAVVGAMLALMVTVSATPMSHLLVQSCVGFEPNRETALSPRACTHKLTAKLHVPPNVRYWGLSGHGADLSVCPLMTRSGHDCQLPGRPWYVGG